MAAKEWVKRKAMNVIQLCCMSPRTAGCSLAFGLARKDHTQHEILKALSVEVWINS